MNFKQERQNVTRCDSGAISCSNCPQLSRWTEVLFVHVHLRLLELRRCHSQPPHPKRPQRPACPTSPVGRRCFCRLICAAAAALTARARNTADSSTSFVARVSLKAANSHVGILAPPPPPQHTRAHTRTHTHTRTHARTDKHMPRSCHAHMFFAVCLGHG
jgi:hypothetical protein